MNTDPGQSSQPRRPSVEAAAAEWIVLHDRGLDAVQREQFAQWLEADPAHREAWERHGELWGRFDALARPRPEAGECPDPDALAPRRARPLRWLAPALLAAAASVAVWWWPGARLPAGERSVVSFEAASYRKEVLPDGSILDLNRGSRATVRFGADARRVDLERGEAQFTVARESRRPFVVRAGALEVRAIGTAFNVKLDDGAIEVLVTEGTVRVSPPAPAAVAEDAAASAAVATVLAELSAGHRVVIPTGEAASAAAAPPAVIVPASPQEVAQRLEWTPRLLDFDSTPLAEVVARFNARNATQLRVGDEALRDLPIVASIRSDNVEGFVRLLEATMGVRAERLSSREIVLRAGR